MKNQMLTIWIVLLTVCVLGTANAQTKNLDEVNWKVFSKNLVHALKSDNAGLQQSAMQFVIRYSDRLDVRDALFDVMHVYRSHNDRNVRLLALAALPHFNSNMAMYFLKRSIKFENDLLVKKHLIAVVSKYEQQKNKVEEVQLAQFF